MAVGRHFGLRRLRQRLPPRHLGPCELVRTQSEGFVGFSLLKNWQNDTWHWEVDVVYPGTPASREPRLQKKTIILKVNCQSAQEMQHEQLQFMLRGPAGSSVSITVKKGFFFTETLVLKRAAPALFDTLLCFGLHFIWRRLGSCALLATLTARLCNGRGPSRRCGQHFDEAILRRVLGGRFVEAIARSAMDDMSRMLGAQVICPFMVSLQASDVSVFLELAKNVLFIF